MRSDDEKLVSQTLAGDRDAFGVLVHKYQEMVYAYAFQKVRNEEDARDIAQEVFWRAYHHLYQLRQPHRFRSWLYTIMSNQCKRQLMSVIKTRQRETALEDATDDTLRVEPAYTAPTAGWQVDLEQALSELPDDNRVAVSMFYMGDHSLKEISEFLGVSVNTVKSKLYRARQQLGNALSERYGRLLESHKLKGGFLMQFMEQIRHIPSPTMAASWSSTAIGKILLSLVMAVCVLIGIARYGTDSSMSLSIDRIGIEEITEVILLTPIADAARSSIPVAPAQTENRPQTASSPTSGDQGRQLVARRATPGGAGETQLPAAAAENGSEKLTFSGRVVDNNGVPVAEAEVLYSIKFNPSESVARTKLDGTFRFKFPRPELKKWDRVSIVATHPDHAIGWRNLQPQSATDVEIQLATPGIISGKIMNEADEPIQNAEARIQYLFSANWRPGVRGGGVGLGIDEIPSPPAKTDTNGLFVLRGLPENVKTNLEIKGPGYAQEMHFQVPVDTKGLEFRLKPEGRIEGRLTYANTGAPVKDASVALQGIHPTTGWGRANVDANGNYFLKNLPAGMYNLYLNEGPEGWTAVAKELIRVTEGQTVSKMDLTLVRGGFITGRVTDQDTNEPIVNHHISFHDTARPESQAAVHGTETDEAGGYRFHAAPGRAMVYTSAPGNYQNVGQIKKYVDVAEAETVAVDFQFSKGIELMGRILTETGEPVVGARITDMQVWHREYDTSDKLGMFTVGGLQTGQSLNLKAEHSGLRLRGKAEVKVQPGASVEIQMERYEQVKISGRVVNRAGEPMPSANISLMRWEPQLRRGRSGIAAVTGGNGWFREIGLIVGDEYVISAKAEGYREAKTEKFTATTEMTQIADLVLSPVGSQFFIEGRVTDTSGVPVRGARVLTQQSSELWEARTDKNGDYRLEGLSMAVIIALTIDHSEYAHHQFKILKTNQHHDLVLVKADGYLTGKVVDVDGKPIERARVRVETEEESSSGYIYGGVRTNVKGEFELKHIKDPIVSIYVSHDRNYKIFEDIAVNQRDLVLTLIPPEPRPEPTPAQRAKREAERAYFEVAKKRSKTLVNQPAPELSVAEWLSGAPTSIEGLKGKTVALHFWRSRNLDVQQVRLLNVLQKIYREKGLVCITICPATAEIETVKRHIAEQSLSHSIALDQPTTVIGADGETFDRYAIRWPPIVLINTAGEITGHTWDDDLENQIQILLAD